MTDLSLNPEAVVVSPGDARRIAEINRLRPTPKPSTTSFASTGSGGVTPVRASDVEERNRIIGEMTPAVAAVQARWDAHEAHWKGKDAAFEKEKADHQAALRANDEARLKAVNTELERKRKIAAFKLAESLIDEIIEQHGLSRIERGIVMKRLLDSGDIHNTETCYVACQELVLARGSTTPVETMLADWRDGLKKKK